MRRLLGLLLRHPQVLLIILLRNICKKNKKRVHRYWVHPILRKRERNKEGDYFKLNNDMRLLRRSYFFKAFRMSPRVFNILLHKISRKITKQTTKFRKPISPGERLAVTLRYLATGDSYFTIGSSYRISKTAVSRIVPETCQALWDLLQPEMLPQPDQTTWKKTASDFDRLWQFPQCVGALDGKHIAIQAPSNTGSLFFNYKKYFSIVLMAVCDANYNFVIVDLGAYGSQNDGGIFRKSVFGQRLENNLLGFPKPEPLLGAVHPDLPFVLVADEAFPLLTNLMRPFPGENLDHHKKIYNYRLSRARRVIENAFGILSSRFRCLRRQMILAPEKAIQIVKATIVLHNFLCPQLTSENDVLEFNESSTGLSLTPSERIGMTSIRRQGRRHSSETGNVRNAFASYFCSKKEKFPGRTKPFTT